MNVPVYEPEQEHFAILRDDYQVDVSLTMHESLVLHLAAHRKLGEALE